MHPHPFCFHLTPSYSLRTPPSLYYFFPFIFSADLFLLPVRIHRRANVVVLVALNVPLRCPSFFFFLSFPFFPSTLLLTHSSLHHSATSGPDLLPHHIPLLLACFFSSSQTFRHELRLQMVFTATNPLLRLHTVKITAANHFKPSLLFYHPQNRTDQVNATMFTSTFS